MEVEEGDEEALPEGSPPPSERSPSMDNVAGLDEGVMDTAAPADAGKSTYDVRPDDVFVFVFASICRNFVYVSYGWGLNYITALTGFYFSPQLPHVSYCLGGL